MGGRAFFEIGQLLTAGLESALHVVHIGTAHGEMLERFGQSAAFEIHGCETASERTCALNSMREQIADLHDL